MRVLLMVAATAAMLGGCSTFGVNADHAISESDARVPRPKAARPEHPQRERTPVERWTRQQRHCEVADRKDQRRCIMPYPGE